MLALWHLVIWALIGSLKCRNNQMPKCVNSSFLVEDSPDFSLVAVRDVQRSVRRLRDAVRTILGRFARVRAAEAVAEDLEVARRLPARERLEDDVVAVLRKRPTIPGSVERDERAALIFLRELRGGVEDHVDRRVVCGE